MVDNQNNVEDVEKVITRGMEITGLDLSSRVAYANQGTELFGAEANTSCTSSWDCNNRNLQDWKKEGEEFYAIYNGGNYYGCIRPQGTPGTVDWGIGVSRASVAVTAYTPAPTKSIDSIVKNVCGISYGSVNNLNGELYLYYAAYTADGTNKTFRSKLVWR